MFKTRHRARARGARLFCGTLLVGGMAGASGCLERPVKAVGPRSTAVISERLTQSAVDKIDLVLAIDNSRSMADKQQILALAVPDLIKGLVNPACVEPETGAILSTPGGPLDQCPEGSKREFEPVLDIHIGIISSSLGGHGSDACAAAGAGKGSNNDKGHLLARAGTADTQEVPTYQKLEFLAWDPDQHLSPPGEADILADSAADANNTTLVGSLREMVLGVGQVGCGYEAQLESWYRFLIDPSPPESVTLDGKGSIVLNGVDKVLLDQRKAFLRPNSLLAIVMLTDENDCSIRESGQYYYAAQSKQDTFRLPRPRAVCDQSPNDECCFSCTQSGPKNDDGSAKCAPDPTCTGPDGKTIYLDKPADNINLRCFNQKRRFGIDFLYPLDRYVTALTSVTVPDRNGQLVANPIFSDLDTSDDNTDKRSPNLVFFAGIVGVPWQDIARTTAEGIPDLKKGLDLEQKARGGFKNAGEMALPIPGKDYNTWDLILGNPARYPDKDALPKDPLMIESVEPRAGSNPITGDPVVDSGQPLGNAINGHEWTITDRNDLQYACIFDLVKVDDSGDIQPDPHDCGIESCDCDDAANDKPLCDPTKKTMQIRAKAYPGLRELGVLKNLGSQGIVASVCPSQLTSLKNLDDTDFGYRPAIGAIVDRLKEEIGTQCLSRTLTANDKGQVPCLILEAKKVAEDAAKSCNACNEKARQPVSAEHQAAADDVVAKNPDLEYNCFCEIRQLENANEVETQADCQTNHTKPGYDLCACQYTPDGLPVSSDGWCYVDTTSGIGDISITENCPDTEKHLIRFAGEGEQKPGSTLYITCTGDTASN